MQTPQDRGARGRNHDYSRRAALALALDSVVGAVGAGLVLNGMAGRVAARASAHRKGTDPGGVLVVLQLSGGNDGLSTVVPYAEDAYHSARPKLARKASDVLQLDEYRGLHSGLARLRARYDEGQVAIIEGIGYERPNRSHFKSLEVWHAGDRAGKVVSEGWIGRLAAAIGDEPDPLRVIHIGKRMPFSVHSNRHPAAAFQAPEVYRWVEHGAALGGGLTAGADGTAGEVAPGERTSRDEVLDHLRRTARDAQASSEAVRSAVARHAPKVEYPDDEPARSLRIAAALIHAGIGTRVVSLELKGFDHHNDLRNRHDRLMTRLDAALDVFMRDLEGSSNGRRTAVLCFSEFGRRVAENGSGGTDHGKAGVAFVLGRPVRGGLHGAPPSLTELSKGDLSYTTDFRSVYEGLAQGLFSVPGGSVVAPDVKPLALADLSV